MSSFKWSVSKKLTLYFANSSKKSNLEIRKTLAAVPEETLPNSNSFTRAEIFISLSKSFLFIRIEFVKYSGYSIYIISDILLDVIIQIYRKFSYEFHTKHSAV